MSNPSDACVEFGRHLKRLRIDRELSQADVAKRAGIAGAYLCLLEKAKKPAPPATTAIRIAEALAMDVEETKAFLANVKAARAEWKQWLGERKAYRRTSEVRSEVPAFIPNALKSSGIDLEALILRNGAIVIPPQRLHDDEKEMLQM